MEEKNSENIKNYYFQILEALKDFASSFEIWEIRNLYGYLQNFAPHIFSPQKEEYYELLFDLYKNQYERQVFHHSDTFTIDICRNIVIVGLKLNQLEWTEAFVENMKADIQNLGGGTYSLVQLMIQFHKGEMTKVVPYFHSEIPYTVVNEFFMRITQLKFSYHSLTCIDEFEKKVKAFVAFSRRNFKDKKPRVFEKAKNFALFAKKIFKFGYDMTHIYGIRASLYPKIAKLQAQLNNKAEKNNKPTTERKWLLEQLESLLNESNTH